MAKKHWKKYREVAKLVDKSKKYSLDEAIKLVKQVAYTKFPATVELHIKTNADPRYQDQMIRWTVVLPHWTWKEIKVAAFVSDDKIKEAQEAGADIVWNQDLLEKIQKWDIDFDVLVTTPDMMRELAKVAKILGPKWLMPSPKAWTVTPNIAETIKQIKKGRIEYKLDKTWNIHIPVGKVTFTDEQLKENIEAVINAILESKPSWVKGRLFKNVVIAPTMWPGIKLDIQG